MTKEFYKEMEPGYYHDAFKSGKSSFKPGNEVQRYWHTHRFEKIVGKIHGNSNLIVDLGCGPGTLISLIKNKFKKAVGIDFDEKQIEFAKKSFKDSRITWMCGDVNKARFKEKFDYIICSEVIEHLTPKDADKLLATMHRLLKDNGKIILTTPNYRSFWPIIEIFVNKLGKVNYAEQHINKLNRKTFRNSVKKNGFSIESLETFYILSPFLAFISPKLSAFVQRIEETVLPWLGSEMILVAKKN